MVLPDSDGIPRVPPYSGSTATSQHYAYGTVTPYGRPFQTVLLVLIRLIGVLQPQPKLVWALPVSLAATQGIDFSFSSSGY